MLDDFNVAEVVASGNSNPSKFTGICTKDLCGTTIIYSPDTVIMARQLQAFLPKVEEAASRISGETGKSIKEQRAISLAELMASRLQVPVPSSSYTVKDEKGTDKIDADLKARCDKIQERLDNKVADGYSEFMCDWKRFYATIMGQLCPATKEELRRSDG